MYYIFLYLFLLHSCILAKDYSIIIEKPFNDNLLSITQDYSRDITAIGFSTNFTTSKQHLKVYTDAFSYLDSLN